MEVSQKQLAGVLGISDRWVRQLKTEYGMFTYTEGRKYNLEKCVQEFIDYRVQTATEDTGGSVKDAHEEIKKEISELKLRRLRRELHAASDVEEFLTNMLVSFRSSLLAVPSRAAPLVAGEDDVRAITATLEKEVTQVLEQLCEYDPLAIDGEKSLDYLDDEDEDEQEE